VPHPPGILTGRVIYFVKIPLNVMIGEPSLRGACAGSIIYLEADMSLLLEPVGLMALGTMVVGLVIFGLAPRLPAMFPAAVIRLVGFAAVCSSLVTVWAITWSWMITVMVACAALMVMLLIHIRQTAPPSTLLAEETESDVPVAPIISVSISMSDAEAAALPPAGQPESDAGTEEAVPAAAGGKGE